MEQQRTWNSLTSKTSLGMKEESHVPSRGMSTDLVKHILYITYIFKLQNLQIMQCSKYVKEHNMLFSYHHANALLV